MLYGARDERFGNARAARNLFEKVIAAQADRLAGIRNPNNTELAELTRDDILQAIGGQES